MATVEGIRPPAVAGRFYPEDPAELAATVDSLLEAAPAGELAVPPTALIVPHAGYTYSGAVAAAAFRALKPFAQCWRRVVLIGPAHYVPVPGLALAPHAAFATPWGWCGWTARPRNGCGRHVRRWPSTPDRTPPNTPSK